MRLFNEANGSFEHKINYVDENNRVLGYDMSSNCCEDFGQGIFGSIPSKPSSATEISIDLEKYSFVDEAPTSIGSEDVYESGGALAFRISAKDLPDCWIVIWNYHNGYYAHGFNSWRENGSL